MSKLDDFARVHELKKEATKQCIRQSGPFTLGPTNRGGIFFSHAGKDIQNDMSAPDLAALRDMIIDFLTSVAEYNG